VNVASFDANGSLLEQRPVGAHGDGVFETMLVKQADVINWSAHKHRLSTGLDKLNIHYALNVIEACVETFLRQHAHQAGLIKLRLEIIRAPYSHYLGYRCDKQHPALTLQLSETVFPSFQAIDLAESSVVLPAQDFLAGIKHCNRLAQVMAQLAISHSAVQTDEALLFNSQGYLVEAITANVFIRQGDSWLTPDLRGGGVDGTVRSILCEEVFPQLGIELTIGDISKHHITSCDEMFICNAIKGIVPVSSLQWADGGKVVFNASFSSQVIYHAWLQRVGLLRK